MNPATLKKIVVKSGQFWQDEIDVDANVFDDVFMEAATRALEKRKDEPGLKVTVIMQCFEKKNLRKIDKHFAYNTYFVLINSGMHTKAELLRKNFFKAYSIDLQKESIKGDGTIRPTTSQNTGSAAGLN